MTSTADEHISAAEHGAMRAVGLSKRYGGWRRGAAGNQALAECSFELPAGKVAALVGANGAGKTTLLTILAGMLTPDTGTVHAGGRVAYVSQEKAVYRHLTAVEMLGIAARLNAVWDGARAQRWLERFDVPLHRPCGKLSGGQQAQVAFAAAVGARADVLLLDEPLANLDPLVRREVMAELLTEAADTGSSVVLSTHVVADLGGVADHLLLLTGGHLVLNGDMDTLLNAHVRYLGPPAEAPPVQGEVIETRHRDQQTSFLIRLSEETEQAQAVTPWTVQAVTLEDLVLAHLASNREGNAA